MIDFKDADVFLSGPMTGIEDWNRGAFLEAEDLVKELGASTVFNPVDLAPGPGEDPKPHEVYMLRTLGQLVRKIYCMDAPYWDALVLLEGWQASEGACMERAVAYAVGIPVVELGDVRRMADEKLHGLLPCPFCGKPAHLTPDADGTFTVGCDTADCLGSAIDLVFYRKSDAIGLWNRRAEL